MNLTISKWGPAYGLPVRNKIHIKAAKKLSAAIILMFSTSRKLFQTLALSVGLRSSFTQGLRTVLLFNLPMRHGVRLALTEDPWPCDIVGGPWNLIRT